MRFSVIIPTFRRPELLRETLERLNECDPRPDEVIVIDADPESAMRTVIDEFRQGGKVAVRYLTSKPSVTVQRNRGIDAATGEVVVFLDDDVDLQPQLFRQLRDVYADPTVIGATGRVIEPDPRRLVSPTSSFRRLLGGRGRDGTFTRFGYPRYILDAETERDVEHMFGCFMSARREVAAAVRFDESLVGYALAEDEDFSYRLSRLGRIRYIPEIVVHHRKLGFSSQDTREFGRLVVKNRAYLFRKNFAQTRLARMQFALLIGGFVLHRLVNREWRGARGLIEGALALIRARA
jgi:GT2 family glycosyltransferase